MAAPEKKDTGHESQAEPETGSYVTFERTGIYVDLKRYFTTVEGQEALRKLAKADKEIAGS